MRERGCRNSDHLILLFITHFTFGRPLTNVFRLTCSHGLGKTSVLHQNFFQISAVTEGIMRHVVYLGPSTTSLKAEALNAQPATGKTETLWPHGRRKRCLCSEEKSKHQHTEFKECKCWQLFVGMAATKNRQQLIVIICAVVGGGGGGYVLSLRGWGFILSAEPKQVGGELKA